MISERREREEELVCTPPFHQQNIAAEKLTSVVCVADLQEDEILFSIPRSAVLNLKTALPTIPAGPMQDAISAMPSWLVCTTRFCKVTY